MSGLHMTFLIPTLEFIADRSIYQTSNRIDMSYLRLPSFRWLCRICVLGKRDKSTISKPHPCVSSEQVFEGESAPLQWLTATLLFSLVLGHSTLPTSKLRLPYGLGSRGEGGGDQNVGA